MPNHSPTPPPPNSPGLLIVGTDTGVGKTLVTGVLARGLPQYGLRIGIMKPIETGVPHKEDGASDAERLQALLAHQEPLTLISPYRFPEALSPLAAARLAGRNIELPNILSAYHAVSPKYDYLLIEGIGGVMVPLSLSQDFRELMVQLALPCLIVSRATLGAINHTLLTIRALEERHIPIAGIVFNRPMDSRLQRDQDLTIHSTIEQIKEISRLPVFGPIGFQKEIVENWKLGIETCMEDPAVAGLIQHVAKNMLGTD